ncbi:MAG TPA: hypothetical protein VFA94_03985 [Acidimicrobiales bacterium]|nr:hypothetical protein [Acidimicrobiales bacterium]
MIPLLIVTWWGALLVVGGALLVVGLVVRRHGNPVAPHAAWEPTEEVFRDPPTNRLMRVWIDPVTGTRHYVPET